MSIYDLLVLGAGPAGLGAAFRAASKGLRVGVLERAGQVGGAAGSFEVAGIRVDHGSHRLHPATAPAIFQALSDLLGDDLQKRPRNGRIRLGGKWIAFPLKAADLIARLSPSFSLRAAFDAAASPLRRPRADNFAEVLRAGLGTAICSEFYFPYARKLWGIGPEEISGEQARRRVSANSAGKLLTKLIPGRGDKGKFFYYPAKGFGQICDCLAEAAVAAGADIELNSEVAGITFSRDTVEIKNAAGRYKSASVVFSTLPLGLLGRLAGKNEPAVVQASGSLQFRSMILVYLVLDVDRYTPYDAHYIPAGSSPVTRISEPKNYRDGPDPGGRTVLCAEIPCTQHDAVWGFDSAELKEVVLRTLAENDLPSASPSGVEVRKLSHAYPVYRTGYETDFNVLDEWADSLPNLITFGRLGLFAHDNTHHALAMAWAAVDAINDDLTVNRELWSSARQSFADHVVED